ncbi:MAG: serine hydrolase domain-containing protein [Longimicrobiales bacterium]
MSAEMSRREFAAALSLLPFTTLQIGAVAKWTPLAPAINKPDATFLAGLDRLMELAGVPGVGVGLVQESRMVWQHHAGVTELNAKPPVTVDTLFPAASLAKPVFAYAVLRLVDQGRLDLDRPLKSYVPNHTPADGRGDRITARHVLSHSSGYRNWRNRTDQPLTAQSYSRDFANRLLAVAESSGKPLARWTHDEIVAAMEKMTPAPPALPNFIIPNAAGSLLTTVADYSLFLGQLLTQSNTTVALKPKRCA